MTAPLPTWTVEELRAMTPLDRRLWWFNRQIAWIKATAEAAATGDFRTQLETAIAGGVDLLAFESAMQAIRREERPVPACRLGPIGPVTVLEHGSLALARAHSNTAPPVRITKPDDEVSDG